MNTSHPYTIGSRVNQRGYVNAAGEPVEFIVVDYWRGEPKLKHEATGTFHVAPVSELSPVRRTYRVILEERLGGAAVGSTNDVLVAVDAMAAEAAAIDAWTQLKPNRTFAPLITTDITDEAH